MKNILKKLILTVLLTLISQVASASAQDLSLVQDMRKSFFAFLNESSPNYSKEKFNKLIYFPAPGMFDENAFQAQPCDVSQELLDFSNKQAIYSLCGIAQSYNNPQIWSAQTLFKLGEQQSEKDMSYPLSTKRNALKEKDVLVVIVPGIFGEFIEQWAFDEVLRPDSLFKTEFSGLVKAENQKNSISDCSKDDVNGKTASCDMQDLLKYLRDESLPQNQDPLVLAEPNGARSVSLEKLFHVGSFDDQGTSWAKVALLNVEGMSLESLGDSRDRAQIFNRRLEKLFKVMGRVPTNIIFVGYSRGTNFALDMLSLAQKNNSPWLKNVKSIVSLGGVVFGSALADEVFVDENLTAYKEMELLKLLRNTLTVVPAADGKAYEQSRIMALNTMAWIKFVNEYIALKIPGAKSKLEYLRQQGAWTAGVESAKMFLDFLKKTSQDNGVSDPSSVVNLALKQAQNFGVLPDLKKLSGASSDLNLDQISLDFEKAQEFDFDAIGRLLTIGKDFSGVLINEYKDEGLQKYNADILRFQKFADAVAMGVEQLSTDSRIKWWSENSVPLTVKYYSLSATMDSKTSDLVNNKLGYNPGSPDDNMLSDNWSKFKDLTTLNSMAYSGSVLNDSQVAIFKTYFWPKVIAGLNPKNAGIQAQPLGVLGTHHWGLALPIVNKVKVLKEGQPTGLLEENPFPRADLLKAITLTILTGEQ